MDENITITLEPDEVTVIAILLATANAPDAVIAIMENIAMKILDAQDLASIPTV